MKIGYARCSTDNQDYEIQVEQLKALGCEKIFAEKASGKSTNGREQLKACIGFAREGDLVVCTKLDRLARNTVDALEIANQLQTKKVGLHLEDLKVDVNSDVGRLVYTTIAAVAEMERKRIAERTKQGREAARANGKHMGRPQSIDSEKVKRLHTEGMGATAIAKELGIGRASVYRMLSTYDPLVDSQKTLDILKS